MTCLSRRIAAVTVFITLLAAQHAAALSEQEVLAQASREIIIKFKAHVSSRKKAALYAGAGAMQIRTNARDLFTVITVPETSRSRVLREFIQHPDIAYAEPNGIIRACMIPNDAEYPRQWHFPMINLENAWDYSTGAGVTVAVLDSGINSHGNDGFGDRLLDGYNALLNIPARWEDFNYHGTHVAGTIGQETNNLHGTAGIAFSARLLPVKVLGRTGYGTRASVASGIIWAADHDADIINMSFGENEFSNTIRDAVDYAYAQGVTLVAAGGNDPDGGTPAPVYYPAAFDHVIAVSAVDGNGDRSFYSNVGPEIDIAAPGGDKQVDADQDGYEDGILQETFEMLLGFPWGAIGWSYYYLQGTSMAAPHVAGVAALIKAAHPEWGPDAIEQALTATAVDLGKPGKDSEYGYGLVDADAAVRY